MMMEEIERFRDRTEAGQKLAEQLSAYGNRPDVLVLGLPRGGVPVAFEIAKALNAPLDVFVVRKLGVPDRPELAMGAIASGGVRVLNQDVVRSFDISNQIIDRVTESEQKELQRRENLYRGNRPAPDYTDRTIILVDDGLATGATMRAAVQALRQHKPTRIAIAVPIAAPETCQEFRAQVDEITCFLTPERLWAVGRGYEDFRQTTDEEVQELLDRSHLLSHSSRRVFL